LKDGLDLAAKAIGVLAALLGLAGYVLVIGAAVLWFRLDDAGLPHEAPIALAGREELIAIGAQAVAVWLILVILLGGLAAWIVAGDPGRRRFGPLEAGLAMVVTVSAILALESSAPGVVAVPATVVLFAFVFCLARGASLEATVATTLPAVAGLAVAVAFSIPGQNGFVEAGGAAFIFGALMAAAPALQRWRARQEANGAAIALLESRGEGELGPTGRRLIDALRHPGGRGADLGAIVWIRRIAIGSLGLLALAVIAVASQVEADKDFHQAVVSLTDGDCVSGTYITRGSDQIVLAQPQREDEEKEEIEEEDGDATHGASGTEAPRRIATFPTKDVVEVQIYGRRSSKDELIERHGDCARHPTMAAAASSGGDSEELDEGRSAGVTEVDGVTVEPGHVPVIDWRQPGTITTTSCRDATLTLTISIGGSRVFRGRMSEVPGSADPGSGTAEYVGGYPPLYPGHGSGRALITGSCPGESRVHKDLVVYVDP